MEGEVLNLAIGQGANSQTPLKVAQFYLALARDGSAPAPAIARGVELGEGWSLDLAPEHIESLREGLRHASRRPEAPPTWGRRSSTGRCIGQDR
jgi:cell division protein FtsI/penicillin-binding protein 2